MPIILPTNSPSPTHVQSELATGQVKPGQTGDRQVIVAEALKNNTLPAPGAADTDDRPLATRAVSAQGTPTYEISADIIAELEQAISNAQGIYGSSPSTAINFYKNICDLTNMWGAKTSDSDKPGLQLKAGDINGGVCYGLTSLFAYAALDPKPWLVSLIHTVELLCQKSHSVNGKECTSITEAVGEAYKHYENWAEQQRSEGRTDAYYSFAEHHPDSLLYTELRPFIELLLQSQNPKQMALHKDYPKSGFARQDVVAQSGFMAPYSLESKTKEPEEPEAQAPLTPVLTKSDKFNVEVKKQELQQLIERLEPGVYRMRFDTTKSGHTFAVALTGDKALVFDQNMSGLMRIEEKSAASDTLFQRLERSRKGDEAVLEMERFMYSPDHSDLDTSLAEINKQIATAISADSSKAFFKAAQRGDIGEIQALLAQGADPDTRYDGSPILCGAARDGQVNIVKALLEAGADPNQKDSEGFSPLDRAAHYGHLEVVQTLLNADKTVIDGTPLYHAAKQSHLEVTKALLDNKADPNKTDSKGLTPLAVATILGDLEIIQALLEHKATPHQADNRGRTPLSIAQESGNNEIIQTFFFNAIKHGDNKTVQALLAEGVDSNIKSNGISALYRAVEHEQIEIIQALLNAGAKPDLEISSRITPLSLAIKKGDTRMIQMLEKASTDTEPFFRADGSEPFFNAIRSGDIKTVQALLVAGVDPNIKDKSHSALYKAAAKDQVEIVQVLLEAGADPDLADTVGMTPLLAATFLEGLEIVQALLENKANPHRADNNGNTPLSMAQETGNSEIIQAFFLSAVKNEDTETLQTLLKGNTHIIHTLFFEAIESGDIKTVQALLAAGVNPDIKDDGDHALSIAAQEKQVEVLQALLNAGANPNQAFDGAHPLYMAVLFGHVEAVKVLLNAGCNPDVFYKTATPLHRAASKGYSEIVQLLLDNNANPSFTDKNGGTPLSEARQGGHDGIVLALLEAGATS